MAIDQGIETILSPHRTPVLFRLGQLVEVTRIHLANGASQLTGRKTLYLGEIVALPEIQSNSEQNPNATGYFRLKTTAKEIVDTVVTVDGSICSTSHAVPPVDLVFDPRHELYSMKPQDAPLPIQRQN